MQHGRDGDDARVEAHAEGGDSRGAGAAGSTGEGTGERGVVEGGGGTGEKIDDQASASQTGVQSEEGASDADA
eukprot:2032065-Pleurochrysis_carterae.AAC.1